jgi:glycosyltransferase involved in cell wall biosynthesis
VTQPLKVAGIEDQSACGYYRIRLPFDWMAMNGIHARYAADGGDLEDQDYPIIVAQRMGYPGFELQWLKLWRDHKLVWETDDDLWTIDPTNIRAKRAFTPELLRAVEHCASTAHMVTVTTEPLAEVLRQFNPNVWVIPNHVDAGLFEVQRRRADRVTIGWAGGDSHYRDLRMIAPLLRKFLARNPKVGLHFIGADYRHECKVPHPKHMEEQNDGQVRYLLRPCDGIEGDQVRHTGWSKSLMGYYQNIDFDIGLAPLVSSQFNRSKSHIKALEYAALGIPVIASDEPPYRDFVIDGVTGFLVRREHEWTQRLRDLVNDEAMRESMGAKAREHARQFSIEKGWRLWEAAYRTLL